MNPIRLKIIPPLPPNEGVYVTAKKGTAVLQVSKDDYIFWRTVKCVGTGNAFVIQSAFQDGEFKANSFDTIKFPSPPLNSLVVKGAVFTFLGDVEYLENPVQIDFLNTRHGEATLTPKSVYTIPAVEIKPSVSFTLPPRILKILHDMFTTNFDIYIQNGDIYFIKENKDAMCYMPDITPLVDRINKKSFDITHEHTN